MIVIKLGGSLSESRVLKRCLNKVNTDYKNNRVVVVPGGGRFADEVRTAQQQWCFDEQTAHYMAILAMQQMALFINSLQPCWSLISSFKEIQSSQKPVIIWSPLSSELDSAGIAASWEITSDSLAAWLAGQLGAQRLILVKSATVPGNASIADLQHQDIIDPAFSSFIRSANFAVHIQNHQQF